MGDTLIAVVVLFGIGACTILQLREKMIQQISLNLTLSLVTGDLSDVWGYYTAGLSASRLAVLTFFNTRLRIPRNAGDLMSMKVTTSPDLRSSGMLATSQQERAILTNSLADDEGPLVPLIHIGNWDRVDYLIVVRFFIPAVFSVSSASKLRVRIGLHFIHRLVFQLGGTDSFNFVLFSAFLCGIRSIHGTFWQLGLPGKHSFEQLFQLAQCDGVC